MCVCVCVCVLRRVATHFGLDGPKIESRYGRDILHPTRVTLGSHTLQYNGYRISFPGLKRHGSGVDHLPPSCAEVKEE